MQAAPGDRPYDWNHGAGRTSTSTTGALSAVNVGVHVVFAVMELSVVDALDADASVPTVQAHDVNEKPVSAVADREVDPPEDTDVGDAEPLPPVTDAMVTVYEDTAAVNVGVHVVFAVIELSVVDAVEADASVPTVHDHDVKV